MYNYLKAELARRDLRYAEVTWCGNEITFVIATDKHEVVEVFFEAKNKNYDLVAVETNNGNFNSALRDYIDGVLNGNIRTIQVGGDDGVLLKGYREV